MIKNTHLIKNLLASIIILLTMNGFAQTSAWYAENEKAIDSLRKGDFVIQVLDENGNPIEAAVSYSLKNHNFPWGTALASPNLNTDYWYAATARKYFNHGVTENAFKWSLMQPNPGPVNYDDVNHYVEWCEKVGWEMRGHALLWGSQNYEDFHPLQKWVKDIPMPEMYDTLKVRVQREMEYYKGVIKEYDVMNEATPGHADWLQRTNGDSVNWDCFKWAREVDSTAKLFINDYSIISGSDYTKYIEMIMEMQENGAPIDGIGVQAHFNNRITPNSMKFILDSLATLGLPIKITEFDMLVGQNNMSEIDQAKHYALAMRTAFAHPAVNGFVFWGFWDSRHWRDEAGLFTVNKESKIAADSVYNLIHTTWTTEGSKELTSDEVLKLNGFYGDYEIQVGNQIVDLTLDQFNENDTITINFSNSRQVAPKLVSVVAFDAHHVKITFDKKVITNDDSKSVFKVYNSNLLSVTNLWQPAEDSTQIMLAIEDVMTYKHELTLSYFPGNVTDENGTSLEFIGTELIDNKIPGFIAGKTSISGDSIIMEFNEAMLDPGTQNLDAFAFIVDNESIVINEIGLVDNQPQNIYVLPSQAILFGQRVKVTYTPGTIVSEREGILAAFGPKLIINMIPTSIDDITFDKNKVFGFYEAQHKKLVIRNHSENQQRYFYNLYNLTGVLLHSGTISANEEIRLDASEFGNQLVILRFESIDRQVRNAEKIMISK